MALLPSHLIEEVNGIRPCMPDSTESKRCMLWNQEPIRIDLKYKCNRDVSIGGGVIADLRESVYKRVAWLYHAPSCHVKKVRDARQIHRLKKSGEWLKLRKHRPFKAFK